MRLQIINDPRNDAKLLEIDLNSKLYPQIDNRFASLYRYLLRACGDRALEVLNTVLFGEEETCFIQRKDFRVTEEPNRNALNPDHFNDLVYLGSKVPNLDAKIKTEATLNVLFDKFRGFFRSKSVDMSQYNI